MGPILIEVKLEDMPLKGKTFNCKITLSIGGPTQWSSTHPQQVADKQVMGMVCCKSATHIFIQSRLGFSVGKVRESERETSLG